MTAPLRFLNGIAGVSSSDPLGQLPIWDPRKVSVWFEDFVGPVLATNTVNNTANTSKGIICTADANTTISVVTDTDAPMGALKIVSGAADNAEGSLRTASPGWILTSGKKFWMEARWEITASSIAEKEVFIGLASYQVTTNFFATAGTSRTFDDGIGWIAFDGTDDIVFTVGEADVFDSHIVIATPVTATWYTTSMYYDGTDIRLWVNGVSAGTLTPDQIPISVVGPTIYFKTGTGAVQSLLVDYMLVAQER
jgi:hypothetical protein